MPTPTPNSTSPHIGRFYTGVLEIIRDALKKHPDNIEVNELSLPDMEKIIQEYDDMLCDFYKLLKETDHG